MKRLVLAGGGHAHVEVLRQFGAEPVIGAEVVLVNPMPASAHTRMLPGLIAGHYDQAACQIDLAALAKFAKAKFVQSSVVDVDPNTRQVFLAEGANLSYDLLSIDVGPAPLAQSIEGALEHGVAVRPVARFLKYWEAIQTHVRDRDMNIAVVGGGASGVELALAMHHRLRQEGAQFRMSVISETSPILGAHPIKVRQQFERHLRERNIGIVAGAVVVSIDDDGLLLRAGARIEANAVIWATGSAPPAWLSESGFDLDNDGFINVKDTLQTVSHGNVFAAGDIATMVNYPRPKSDAYAMQLGVPLAQNLRRVVRGMPLKRYVPRHRTLDLISAGDKYAMATWGSLTWAGRWVWDWKDRIDRKFIQRYAVYGD